MLRVLNGDNKAVLHTVSTVFALVHGLQCMMEGTATAQTYGLCSFVSRIVRVKEVARCSGVVGVGR